MTYDVARGCPRGATRKGAGRQLAPKLAVQQVALVAQSSALASAPAAQEQRPIASPQRSAAGRSQTRQARRGPLPGGQPSGHADGRHRCIHSELDDSSPTIQPNSFFVMPARITVSRTEPTTRTSDTAESTNSGCFGSSKFCPELPDSSKATSGRSDAGG